MRRITPDPIIISKQEYDTVEAAVGILCRLCDTKNCRNCKLSELKEKAHIAAMRSK